MPHPGRWAGADVQADLTVACEAAKGQWVVSFTACGMMALRTCQTKDDVMQAGLCLLPGLSSD